MKYLRIFEKESDYTQYVGGGGDDYVTPHVALVRRTNAVKYKEYDKTNDYCTIEALEDGLTVTFHHNAVAYYSVDNCKTWVEMPEDSTTTPPINTGEKISFKQVNTFAGWFDVDKKFNLRGNAMSLIFGDEGKNNFDLTGYDGAFMESFRTCETLQSVSKKFLPATTLAYDCYCSMFADCISLVNAPELPATNLAPYCYLDMFSWCTSLVNAPALPATNLAENCYESMFSGCISLTTAPALPATTLAVGCYSFMFTCCESLTTAPALPATNLTESCYSNMFEGCTSLVNAPALPATTLTFDCYSFMFGNTSLLTAPTLPATELAPYCYCCMFINCDSLVTAPELPATELAEECYAYMFQSCSNLNYIKALFTTEPSDSYTNDWVDGVSSTGTFVKSADAAWDVRGVDAIPEGWTVETASA